LGAQNHVVNITDNNGCTATANDDINTELVATATPTDISCSTAGQILVNTGGTGSGSGYQFSVVPDGNPAGTYSTTNPIPVAAANTYDVYVLDGDGCPFVIQDVVVNEFIDPSMVVTSAPNPVCFGETSVVTVTISDGLAPYSVNITNGGSVNQTVSTSTTTVNFPGLSGDTYTVTLTDANGCPSPAATFNLTIDELPEIDAIISGVVPMSCIPYTGNESQFGFDYDLPAALSALAAPYFVQVRDNSGTWFDDDGVNTFTSIPPETTISPAVRIIHRDPVSGVETQVCFRQFVDFETTYTLSGLVINTSFNISNCEDGIEVVVQASGGSNMYVFARDAIPGPIPAGWDSPDVLGGNSRTYPNLIPGATYTFYVADTVTGCIEQETIVVTPPDPADTIPITSIVTTEGCGAATGEIEFTVDNSNGLATATSASWHLYDRSTPLSDPLSGSAIESGTVPAGASFAVTTSVPLAAGTYYLIIEEPGTTPTCRWASADVDIIDGVPITADLNVVNNITCSVDGVISIDNVAGGFPGYTYSVNSYQTGVPANTITSSLSGNLVSVAYADASAVTSVTIDVTVTDSKNCSNMFSQVLTVNPIPTITGATGDSCSSNKSIEITVSGGTAPYMYSVDGGATYSAATTATTYTVDGLTTGDYNAIQVQDNNGCIATFGATVSLYDDIDFTTNLVTSLDCVPNVGVYEIAILSGSGNFTFDIQNAGSVSVDSGNITSPATTATFDIPAASPGDYDVIVTDTGSGCSITKTITVAPAVIPTFTAVGVDAICDGDSNGRINITTTAGVIPVTYQATTNPGGVVTGTWDATESAILGLPAGTYDVVGTGSNGCVSAVQTITIDDFDPVDVPNLTINPFNCTTDNVTNEATIVFDSTGITGGSGTYTIELHEVVGASDVVVTSGLNISSGIYTYTITDESGADYYIRVTDNEGCTNVSASDTLPAFERLTGITATEVTPLDCNNDESISVEFTSTNTVTGATITIVGDVTGAVYAPITSVSSGTPIAVGYTLPADTYTITVSHSTGCELSTRYTVEEPIDHIINVTPVNSVSCFGGADGDASFIIDSSTPYTGAYTYQVLTSPGGAVVAGVSGSGVGNVSELISADSGLGLSAGTYVIELTMTATPDCVRTSAPFTIAGPTAAITVTPTANPISCIGGADGSISVVASGGWGNYNYQLNTGTIASLGGVVAGYDYATNTTNNLFENLSAGNYVVSVRDSEGCIEQSEVTLADPTQVGFSLSIAHNACSPSGGDITVTATGGTGSYRYILFDSTGATELRNQIDPNNVFVGLSAGDYIVQVEDSNGCGAVATQPATINEDLDFTTNLVTSLDCVPNVGVYEIAILSGSGNFTFD
ncbi:SprB repeat-containing protein, partial [uncultured Tenacibaculum sp.]